MQDPSKPHFTKTYDDFWKTSAIRKWREENQIKCHRTYACLSVNRSSVDGLFSIRYIEHLVEDGSNSKST